MFQVAWAAAVLFHLAGNPTLAPWWGRLLLGTAALLAIVRPRTVSLTIPLAVAVLVNVWLEAPVLGNHWLLHGFVAIVVVGGAIAGRCRPAPTTTRIIGPLRLTLLAFYSFAAFAKLNADFFDPAVSCAVFYLRESADSWGALALVDGLGGAGERAVAVIVAVVELSIPVLLFLRRTRNLGVVVGLVFHLVLAVDRSHQFADFSSILAVLFLLFLDPSTVSAGVHRLRRGMTLLTERVPSAPELLRTALVLLVGAVVAYASGPSTWNAPPVLRELAVFGWIVTGGALIGVVVTALRDEPGGNGRLLAPGSSRWLLVVPLLAFLNGLTPYLEIKTGTGWNMYSNLAVIDGESNHYLIRNGLPLTDGHERLVQIVEADGVGLEFYLDSEWVLPEQMLLDHLADRPDARVEAVVDGRPVTYVGGESDGRPEWLQKFQVFRAVDASGAVDCQPSFGPAR